MLRVIDIKVIDVQKTTTPPNMVCC